MSPTDLPALHEAVVPWSTVEALFDDLAALADVREVQLKGGAERYATTIGAPDLALAREALMRGAATAVQIRYLHGGSGWCDTIIRVRAPGQDGARIVRIAWDA